MAKTAPLTIVHTNSAEEARRLIADGYVPVECSIGGSSVVDDIFKMDHHGELSSLEGVAVRAYRDFFGARRESPRFVVTGKADADATFAIASLAGLLPHGSRSVEFEKAPPFIREPMTADYSPLADLINARDCDINAIPGDFPQFEYYLLWEGCTVGLPEDALAFYAGVGLWQSILARAPKMLLSAAQAEENERIRVARHESKIVRVSSNVIAVESPVFGFDVWYAMHPGCCCVARAPDHENITVGCPSVDRSVELFGDGGLKRVFSRFNEGYGAQPNGWGGREVVGGSPRGRKMTWDETLQAAVAVASLTTTPHKFAAIFLTSESSATVGNMVNDLTGESVVGELHATVRMGAVYQPKKDTAAPFTAAFGGAPIRLIPTAIAEVDEGVAVRVAIDNDELVSFAAHARKTAGSDDTRCTEHPHISAVAKPGAKSGWAKRINESAWRPIIAGPKLYGHFRQS